jgi:hypothetical protein
LAPRIFVNIAAYRDRDCANTIRDLFDKARWPDRVFVGLVWQFRSPDDDDCCPVPLRRRQCRVIEIGVERSEGVCWARHQAQSLWRGEEFALQIDSHMRFVAGWDEKLLAMLALCPSPRPILSNYPSAFTPPDRIDSHVVSVIYAAGFDHDRMVKQNSVGHDPRSVGRVPKATPFCAGGFLFGAAEWFRDVPYDPYLYFIGEESSVAVRLYTHGWDLFTPTDVVLYHDYNDRPDRPRHWHDRPDWTRFNARSIARVRHLLGIEESRDPEVLREIDRYGLGSRRSLAEYQEFAGVDFRAGIIR